MPALTFHYLERVIQVTVVQLDDGRCEWQYTIDGGPIREGRPLHYSIDDAGVEALDTAKREIDLVRPTDFGNLSS